VLVGLYLLPLSVLKDYFPCLYVAPELSPHLLFAIVAFLIFTGHPATALTKPLPFFAYPFYAATLAGWAWDTTI